MHFSKALIIAVAGTADLWSLTNAAPPAGVQSGVSVNTGPGGLPSILRDPRQVACIDWADDPQRGGRFAVVYENHDHCSGGAPNGTTHQNSARDFNQLLGLKFDKFKNIPAKVAGTIGDGGKYQCIKGGLSIYEPTLKTLATQACNAIAENTVPGNSANKVWNVWQNYQRKNIGPTGGPVTMNFAVQRNGNNPPQFTETLCQAALNALASQFCTEKTGSGKDNQPAGIGGLVQLFNKQDYLNILIDPQSNAQYTS